MSQLLIFLLDDQRYALNLTAVERVFRAVELTPLPKAPEIILGVMNMQGRIIPVVNMRQRFRLSCREIDLSDQLIVTHTAKRLFALVADAVIGVVERAAEEVTASERIFPQLEYVQGIAKLQDGLVLIHDLDRFLSLEEEETLSSALDNA